MNIFNLKSLSCCFILVFSIAGVSMERLFPKKNNGKILRYRSTDEDPSDLFHFKKEKEALITHWTRVYTDQMKAQSLILSGENLNDIHAKAIAHVLETNPNLKSLDLSGNNITDAGALDIANALVKNRHLISLSLADNDFTKNGTSAFLRILKNRQTKLKLDVKNVRLEVEAIRIKNLNK